MIKKLRLNSEKDTDQFAKLIAKNIFPGMIIGLSGDLGSGKTTFTKYLAKHMGVKDTLNSPTFTLLKTYQGDLNLYHMDVYRLENIGYDYELDDYIYGDGVAVIEWYPYIISMLPDNILTLTFTFIDDVKRDLVIEGSGKYEKILQEISD
ncbi:tRNA (adenosine(37)-N6)-threonylcarbamoyltransferase complex ATPase subunit type 1 TsaE [Hujiaoplasma nucleasis]|uniref:tRNA threonylcarbamoyladenosine biosynthesis protein TsaE n=1 Tax=Hujiaoplasma nucleasis TaxID=2725268 RepID=A0A7L6N667_9MOLU|nr:tRNA (adenosine(37)-N6)-threonylcarbamoyltransferase complex ATPase subunit type 1 TsaE [Hujiaoplasma nucleasis]QLY40495.1 tRNA (adenosine(37)-N6)-threonylcarbamoyltransferase complex ATPase subunit type 1 TsaE [Hujiaoplasma nucleasis]